MKELSLKVMKRLGPIRGPVYLDTNKDLSHSIFLAGDGRSGTTWISNIINYRNDFRYMFEPFHPHYIRQAEGYRFFQYLRPENKTHYFIDTAWQVFSGTMRSIRVDRFNRKTFVKKRLVKDIFSNLSLKWINTHFPDVKIILLLRHPCAVAVSKKKLREKKWMVRPQDFLEQQKLVDDYLHPFVDDIRTVEGFFEKQILIWSIIHYVPLRQFQKCQIHLAFYENFCVEPEEEISRLFSFLQEDLPAPLPDKILKKLKQPSQLVHQTSAIITGESLIDTWRKNVTDSQMDRAMKILKRFQLDTIYSTDAMPHRHGAYAMMAKTESEQKCKK